MASKMYLTFVLLIFVIPAANCETTDIKKRLDATEALVHTLLKEVDKLKIQDELQRTKIAQLENRLNLQQQRSSYLDRLIRRLMAPRRDKSSFKGGERSASTGNTILKKSKGSFNSRIRRAQNETPVAFFATMGNHLEHAGVHQVIVFENVVTNVGNAYNNHVGTFIAPVSGTYVFSTTLVSFYHMDAHAQFVKNGKALTTMFVSGAEGGNDTTGQTIVLQLQKGDDVCIQNADGDKSFYGYNHSIFSGFLLQEDFSSPAVVGK